MSPIHGPRCVFALLLPVALAGCSAAATDSSTVDVIRVGFWEETVVEHDGTVEATVGLCAMDPASGGDTRASFLCTHSSRLSLGGEDALVWKLGEERVPLVEFEPGRYRARYAGPLARKSFASSVAFERGQARREGRECQMPEDFVVTPAAGARVSRAARPDGLVITLTLASGVAPTTPAEVGVEFPGGIAGRVSSPGTASTTLPMTEAAVDVDVVVSAKLLGSHPGCRRERTHTVRWVP